MKHIAISPLKNISKKRNSVTIFLLLCFASTSIGACASFADKTRRHHLDLERGNYDLALEELEHNDAVNTDKNRVLYLLDKGMILHLAGRYQESNTAFDAAERQSEEYMATSISEEAASIILNDNTKVYPGEDFERVMINLYMALNYLMMHDLENALVECRRVDIKLNDINAKYKKKNVYREDGFARWLSGTIYEASGDINNALIAYRQAIGIYEKDYTVNYRLYPPRQLITDYISALKQMGSDFEDELKQAEMAYGKTDVKIPSQDEGTIIFIYQGGRSPEKKEAFLAFVIDNTVVKLAFPEYVKNHYLADAARITVANTSTRTEKAEDITHIAIKNLSDRAGRITAKEAARAVAKYSLKKAADKAHPLFGLLVNATNVATEQADTRSWLTLPGEFGIARLTLPAGEYTADVEYLSSSSAAVYREKMAISVKAKETTFITRRTFY